MSYRSVHLESPAAICRFKGKELTLAELCKLTRDDIFGWYAHHYGNTKFEDLAIVIAWILRKFNLLQTAIMVGYSINKDGGGRNGLRYRLERIDAKDYLELIRNCIRANLLTKADVSKCLEEALYKNTASKEAKRWGKSICIAAVKKWGTDIKAARQLGITVECLHKWYRP